MNSKPYKSVERISPWCFHFTFERSDYVLSVSHLRMMSDHYPEYAIEIAIFHNQSDDADYVSLSVNDDPNSSDWVRRVSPYELDQVMEYMAEDNIQAIRELLK